MQLSLILRCFSSKLCITSKQNEIEILNGASVVRATRATPVLPPGVTDDTPDFSREMVMLDISEQLYGESASRVIDISKIVGSFMMVNNCMNIQHHCVF